ncbi:ATP-dependent RNA helicase RhlE, partial [Sodalis-like symbiont of Bactericera trigonica]
RGSGGAPAGYAARDICSGLRRDGAQSRRSASGHSAARGGNSAGNGGSRSSNR